MARKPLWLEALRNIPRLTKEEWDHLAWPTKWLIATRSAVLLMTFLSGAIGGILAFRDGLFHPLRFCICIAGLMLAHATNNLVNDWVDFKKGIDQGNYYRTQYGPQTLQSGYSSPRQFFTMVLVTGLCALACAFFLIYTTPIGTLILTVIGAFFLFFYTWPLKYIGLGEPTVVLVWGPLMVGGTYYAVSGGVWSWDAAWISLIYALGPTTVLLGKHIDKRDQDLEKRVRTLPVILGEKRSRNLTILLWILQYMLTGVAVFFRWLHPVLAVVLIALPRMLDVGKVFAKPKPSTEPEGYPPDVWPLFFSAHAFIYNRRFGSLLLLGLILDVFFFGGNS